MKYTAFEYILYNSIRSGAIIALAFGILRKKSRFSQELTAVLFALMTGVWVASSAVGLYFLHRYNLGATVEVLQSIMLLVFMVIAIKDNLGKLMFIFFMLYTVGGLVSIAGKFIEIQIWPVQAYYAYRWTATVGLLLAILLILVPFGLAIYYDACAIMGKEGESAVWRADPGNVLPLLAAGHVRQRRNGARGFLKALQYPVHARNQCVGISDLSHGHAHDYRP